MYRLGIVLSGGGARGIAHVGILEALREHGLVFDCLSGTSTGAIVGAFYAAGFSSERMLEFFDAKSPFRLSRLSVSKPGFIDTAKVRNDLLEFLPEDSFESLSKKLFITATDIVHGREVVFRSGPLVSAILAAASFPGVFTPTRIDGRLYVDGGVVNNFPVEPLKGLCDVIVGVYTGSLRRVTAADMSGAISVVQRSLEVGIYFASKAKLHDCDVMIQPRGLDEFTTFDTKHVREIFELGYRQGLEHVARVEDALEAMA